MLLKTQWDFTKSALSSSLEILLPHTAPRELLNVVYFEKKKTYNPIIVLLLTDKSRLLESGNKSMKGVWSLLSKLV